MATVIPIPLPGTQNPTILADWIEINTLLDRDGVTSRQDLVDLLEDQSSEEQEDQVKESRADILANSAFSEIERRVIAAAEGYPFELNGDKLQKKKKNALPYIFCLLISYFGLNRETIEPLWQQSRLTKKFEDLAAVAINFLLDNKKIKVKIRKFGYPRKWRGTTLNPHFPIALKKLCLHCKEMNPKELAIANDCKDGGLDILAWKPFPDELKGSLIFWGQCAAGDNWEGKLEEVRKFQYFIDAMPTQTIIGTFIPHIPDISDQKGLEKWWIYRQQGGMLFNRCRIAFLADRWNDTFARQFCNKALKVIRTSPNLN